MWLEVCIRAWPGWLLLFFQDVDSISNHSFVFTQVLFKITKKPTLIFWVSSKPACPSACISLKSTHQTPKSHEIAESSFFEKHLVLRKYFLLSVLLKTVFPFLNSWAAFVFAGKLVQVRFKRRINRNKRVEGKERRKYFVASPVLGASSKDAAGSVFVEPVLLWCF